MGWIYYNFTIKIKNQIKLNSSYPLSCWGSWKCLHISNIWYNKHLFTNINWYNMHLPVDSNWFYCTTLGIEISSFAKNKKVPGFQYLFGFWNSTMPCDSWFAMSQITATKQIINTKWLKMSHHYSKIGLRAIENIIFSLLINPNFCWGNHYFLY